MKILCFAIIDIIWSEQILILKMGRNLGMETVLRLSRESKDLVKAGSPICLNIASKLHTGWLKGSSPSYSIVLFKILIFILIKIYGA